MKKVLLILLTIFVAFSADAFKKPKFKPYVIENLEPRPDFWKVRPVEVIDLCKNVKKGEAKVVAKTPLGYPVYAVFYGDFSDPAPQTNWSAGNSSTSIKAYLGPGVGKQTIMFIAGVHGSEPENVAAAMNMIQMLETGKDFRGETDAEFLSLASKYRIIIMPCVNMDGRLISPDHFRNQPYEIFRGCSQGWWKDGSLVGWKGSKEWFPLPLDKVKYPGGYPNSEGYNIQHDACPGDMKTEEAKAVCRVMARYRVDFMLNGHSCEAFPYVIYPSQVDNDVHKERLARLGDSINHAFHEAGLTPHDRKFKTCATTINLTNFCNFCSGGIAFTLECNHSCYNAKGIICTQSFEEMMAPAMIALKVAMKDGLDSPLASRPAAK